MVFITYVVPLRSVDRLRTRCIADGKVEGVDFVIKTRTAGPNSPLRLETV